MPELPEVETIVRQLRADMAGKKLWSASIKNSSVILPNAKFLKQRLPGLRVINVKRLGKFIVVELTNKMKLVIHLRMTGRLMWKKQKGREKYIIAGFSFTDGSVLYFSDVRKFGRIWLYNEKDYERQTGIFRLGPDPLQDGFNKEAFMRIFKGRSGSLKANLLRQDLISGIGNIYADEVCFNAGISPERRSSSLKTKELEKVFNSIIYCLNEGIKHCGVSVSDFVGTRGDLGKHQHYLQVYGREGDKCYRCNKTIQKTRLAGRGTFYCPGCQK